MIKKIAIPKIKTICGELVSGLFSFSVDSKKITLELFPQGSQLLEYSCNFFIKIVNNRSKLYLISAKKIFWRLNTMNLSGSRKEMVNELFDRLISFMLPLICL